MALHKIEFRVEDRATDGVWLDGKKVEGVRSFSIEADADSSMPIVRLELHAYVGSRSETDAEEEG